MAELTSAQMTEDIIRETKSGVDFLVNFTGNIVDAMVRGENISDDIIVKIEELNNIFTKYQFLCALRNLVRELENHG